jgi:high affinity Mn2+ porin
MLRSKILPIILFIISISVFINVSVWSQNDISLKDKSDSIIQPWNFHYQQTVIGQYHPPFHALYSGMNSLKNNVYEYDPSLSSTLFFGFKFFAGTQIHFDPEVSGGSGFSSTTGIAGFPNGEIYRVSNPSPHIYVARLFLRQIFPLTNETGKYDTDAQDQVACREPLSFIALTAGRFSLMDFFDKNTYSHDPRNQFYNWALMGNGAWDYAANTRGYTYGIAIELVMPLWTLRYSSVMEPTVANESVMDPGILHSRADNLEFEYPYKLGNKSGTIRVVSWLNEAHMGNYHKAIEWGMKNDTTPDITKVEAEGRTKLGFGINIEQELSSDIGFFLRTGWNDGQNETWAFTEIDRTLSMGISMVGEKWLRKDDNLGIAVIINGLSAPHRDYLKAGGYGFIIGDGNLNYSTENIFECFYSYKLKGYPLRISPDYQFVLFPAYNKDRGPVNIFGLRVHIEL